MDSQRYCKSDLTYNPVGRKGPLLEGATGELEGVMRELKRNWRPLQDLEFRSLGPIPPATDTLIVTTTHPIQTYKVWGE